MLFQSYLFPIPLGFLSYKSKEVLVCSPIILPWTYLKVSVIGSLPFTHLFSFVACNDAWGTQVANDARFLELHTGLSSQLAWTDAFVNLATTHRISPASSHLVWTNAFV
jgi:hypothetical protein